MRAPNNISNKIVSEVGNRHPWSFRCTLWGSWLSASNLYSGDAINWATQQPVGWESANESWKGVHRAALGGSELIVTLMGIPGGILNSLKMAAFDEIFVCAEALTQCRESPRDVNYFNPFSGEGLHFTMKRQTGSDWWNICGPLNGDKQKQTKLRIHPGKIPGDFWRLPSV